MNILFISDAARNYSVGGFEPLGIMYLSPLLKQAGHQVNICDASEKCIKNHLSECPPDIIAYSVTTGAHQLFLDINRKIKKEHRVFSIFGGPHPTFFPQMIEEEGVDAICIGEGEEAFLELVTRLARRDDITTVRNIHLKHDGVIYRNDVRPLIEDLDRVPFPDRELFYTYPLARASKMKTFIASRGCPYKCTYCFNHLYNTLYRGKGKIIRFRSPDNVVEEVASVKERYPLEFVVFHDSSFLFSADWLREFCAKFKEKIGLPFNCNARADHITEENVARLKEGGCFSVVWAAEAGNDHIRNEILKRNLSKETMRQASRLLQKFGINYEIQNIIGIPGEGLRECVETLDFNIECRPGYASTSLLYPYPGTEIYDIAVQMGLLAPRHTHFDETFYVRSPLNLPDKKKIENLQKLFSITVEFPWLKKCTLLLIRLPLGPLYNFVRRIHKGFCLRYRIFYYKINLMEYAALALRFMRSKAG